MAGDQFQGTLFYTYYSGSSPPRLMYKIGYDAMAVGNHEFDDGPEVLADSSTRSSSRSCGQCRRRARATLLADRIGNPR